MEKSTYAEIRYYEEQVHRDYNKLINGADINEIIDLFFNNGFRFEMISGVESHDIGDQDYCSGHIRTDDPAEIKRFISKLYGEWLIIAFFDDKKVKIENQYISVWNGISFEYPVTIENEIEHVFKKFEEKFCFEKTAINKDENPRFETADDIGAMACVYASPERMSEMFTPISNSQTYPYTHAVQDDSEAKRMMGEVYGSPQMMDDMMPMVAVYASPEMMDGDWKLGGFTKTQTKSDKSNKTKFCEHCGKRVDSSWSFCSSCGSAIGMADPEVTIQFCIKCGRENPLSGRYCVYCGNEMGLIQSRDECDAPMACVYASPERMSVTDQKKESFIKRLFRRKNK